MSKHERKPSLNQDKQVLYHNRMIKPPIQTTFDWSIFFLTYFRMVKYMIVKVNSFCAFFETCVTNTFLLQCMANSIRPTSLLEYHFIMWAFWEAIEIFCFLNLANFWLVFSVLIITILGLKTCISQTLIDPRERSTREEKHFSVRTV